MSPHELKALNTRLAAAEADHRVVRDAAKEANRKEAAASNKVKALKEQIAAAKAGSAGPIITEHALLRFLERVYGIDLQKAREAMVGDGLAAMIQEFKSGRFPIDGYDCFAVVKDRSIVTVEMAQ
jgi:hypothetical protein